MPTLANTIRLTAAVAVGLSVTLIALRSDRPGVTLQAMDELIKKAIPIGSTKDRVYAFLDSRKIMSTGYDVGPDPSYGLPSGERERKRYVIARIPEHTDPAVSGYDIRIIFYFDEDENLIDYKLQQLDNVL